MGRTEYYHEEDIEIEAYHEEDIEIEVYIIEETSKAIMFFNDSFETVWLPKSQILIERDNVDTNRSIVWVPLWLIVDNDLDGASCIV